MKRSMKWAIAILLPVLLALWVLSVDLYENGFALAGGCDYGFGNRLKRVQEKGIRGLFKETLPETIDVVGMACSGFTDSTVVVTFRISDSEARQLLKELEMTFLSPQNHPIVSDAQKRRRMVGRPTSTTYIYELPGSPKLDTRTVSVTIPKEAGLSSTVVLEGGNF